MVYDNYRVFDFDELEGLILELKTSGQRIDFLSFLSSRNEKDSLSGESSFGSEADSFSIISKKNISDFLSDDGIFKDLAFIFNDSKNLDDFNDFTRVDRITNDFLSNNFLAYIEGFSKLSVINRVGESKPFKKRLVEIAENEMHSTEPWFRINECDSTTSIQSIYFLSLWSITTSRNIQEKVADWFETHNLKEVTPYAVHRITKAFADGREGKKTLEYFESIPLSWLEETELSV